MAQRFSFVPSRSLAILAAGCLATVLAIGCNDPELERLAAFERQYNQVQDEFGKVFGDRPDLLSTNPSEESISALRGIADRAKGLSGGSAGQMAAARMLATSVYRTSASIELARATWLESSQQTVREMVMSASSIAADLEAVADASDKLALSAARTQADGYKSAGADAARELEEAVRSFEGPANELNTEISEATARLAELNQQSAVLLRKSRESSAKAGLAFVEEAAGIKAEARELAKKTAISQLEAEAAASSARIAQAQLGEAEGLESAAGKALELIGDFKSDNDSAAAKCRDLAKELRKRAETMMKSISDERSSALKAAYEAAASDLMNAAGDAQGDALKNTLLCEELRMRVTEVNGLGAQARMMKSVGGSSAAGMNDIKSAAETALTALREKATAAAELFANAGEDPAQASLKAYVDGVKKMADETSVDRLINPPTIAAEPKASGGSSGRSMSGAAAAKGSEADLEAVVAKLNGASTPAESARLMLEVVDDSTGAARAMRDIVAKGIKMMEPLMAAVEEKFGAEGAKSLGSGMAGGMGGMAGGSLGLSGLTKKSFDGSKAVYTDSSGQDITFVFTSAGWKVDLLAAMPPQQAAMMEQAGPMIDMVMKPMTEGMKALAERVRNGEFNSAEEVAAAIQKQMMESMGGGMGGGMGGMGGRRRPPAAPAEGDN